MIKLPNIYRSFTEWFRKTKQEQEKLLKIFKLQSLVTVYILTVFLLLIFSVHLLISLQKQKEVNFEKEKIQSQIKLWEGISEKFQGYKEAYYQLALLNYKIGEIEKAKYYVDKALYLDPNFDKARNLQNILKNY